MKKQIAISGLSLLSIISYGQNTIPSPYNTGDIGIGTLNPTQKLEVLTNGANAGIKITNTSATGAGLWLSKNGYSGRDWLILSTGSSNGEGAGHFNIVDYYPNGASRLFIKGGTNAGEVGIGTTLPLDKLHVMGGARFNKAPVINNGFNAHLYIGNGDNTKAFNFQLNSDGSQLHLWTFNGGWGNKFAFSANGSLLINTPFGANGLDANAKLAVNGKTQIGNAINGGPHAGNYLLSVNGKGVFKEIIVTNSNWADFVFNNEYILPSLKDVEAYYKENKHLPEIPSAKEVEENGYSVGEMNKLLLQKIEELTLYVVQQQKEIDALKKKSSE